MTSKSEFKEKSANSVNRTLLTTSTRDLEELKLELGSQIRVHKLRLKKLFMIRRKSWNRNLKDNKLLKGLHTGAVTL